MIRVLAGDCRDILPTLSADSVQCCVTSPPYYGLRSYLDAAHPDKHREIGQENSPADYIATMVEVFRELKRALRPDGTVWLNVGDSFCPENRGENAKPRAYEGYARYMQGDHMHADLPTDKRRLRSIYDEGIKRKDLMMIPARLAIALQQDGWWIRADVIWHKIAPMPESVRDRPTRAHEYVFLLTKSERYFYNHAAARDPLKATSVARLTQPLLEDQAGSIRANGGAKTNGTMKAVAAHFGGRIKSQINDQTRLASGNEWQASSDAGANWRDVWSMATGGFDEAHFAVMPTPLAERCIIAGSRPGDTVLDPFAGAGTTLLVADRMQRDAVGIDLNAGYTRMAIARCQADAPLLAEITP